MEYGIIIGIGLLVGLVVFMAVFVFAMARYEKQNRPEEKNEFFASEWDEDRQENSNGPEHD